MTRPSVGSSIDAAIATAMTPVPVTNKRLVRRNSGRSWRDAPRHSNARIANSTAAATANARPRAPPAAGMQAPRGTSARI